MKRQVTLELSVLSEGNLWYFSLFFRSLNSIKTYTAACLTAECRHAVMYDPWQSNRQTSLAYMKPRRLLSRDFSFCLPNLSSLEYHVPFLFYYGNRDRFCVQVDVVLPLYI